MSENDTNPEDAQDKDVEEGTEDTGADEGADGADKGEEGTDKKPDQQKGARKDESPADRVARLRRQLSRAEKDAGVQTEKPQTKSGELDYGQKAFLVANGIKGADEVKLVKEFMKNTGKSLDEALESKYLQAELKDHRDSKVADAAVPRGTKRSGQSARDSVEYWVQKGELPPADQVELRRKVVNAKMKAAQDTNVFTSQSVIGG